MSIFFTNELFQNYILPFLFIFALVFAILEKSKLLGEDKRQINAIIGFVAGLILISFSKYVLWINQLIVFLIVGLIILFVLMLLYSFVYGDKTGDPLRPWLKTALGLLIVGAVIMGVLVITGVWDNLKNSSDWTTNAFFLVLVVGAVIAVLVSGRDKKNGAKE